MIHNNIANAITTGNIYHTQFSNQVNNYINYSNDYSNDYSNLYNYIHEELDNENHLIVNLPVINEPKYFAPELKSVLPEVDRLFIFKHMIWVLKKRIINNMDEYVVLNRIPIDNTISMSRSIAVVL